MGLDIPVFPVYKNSANVVAYSNIRGITQDKSRDKYILSGVGNISTNSVLVESIFIEVKSDEPFLNVWEPLYESLKEKLTKRDIEFTNV